MTRLSVALPRRRSIAPSTLRAASRPRDRPLQPAGVGVSIPKEWNAHPRTKPESLMSDFEQLMASPIAAYDEALAFFRGQGMLNQALLRIAADLERNG